MQVKVFDNVLSDEQIKKWIYFYENVLAFKRATLEHPDEERTYFASNVSIKENIEIFDYEKNIVPYAQQINSKVRGNYLRRSYINIFDQFDTFTGHTDCNDEDFYVSTVLFLNPHWDNDGGGLKFTTEDESIVVDNVFNRLICFNGNIHHCVQPYNSERARVTHYCTFADSKYTARIADKNRW